MIKELIEAVESMLNHCPQGVDPATVPKSGNIDDAPGQVILEMSVSYLRIKKIKELIQQIKDSGITYEYKGRGKIDLVFDEEDEDEEEY